MTDEEKVFEPVEATDNEVAPAAVSEDVVPSQESEASETPVAVGGGESEAPQRDDICRDFLKNICNRGSRCKFFHPSERKQNPEEHINFCIDYQNRGCMRDGCRFVHATREDVERYKITQEVTLPLARAIAAVSSGNTIAGIPLCKEFQTGRCNRGGARCRYWHVNVEEERERRARGLPPSGGPPAGRFGGPGGGRFGGPTPGYGMRRPGGPMDGSPYEKQPRLDDQRVMDLERRNSDLTREIDTLKSQLQRERTRYEDLYALFRQQTTAAKPAPPAAAQGYSASAAQGYSAPAAQGYQASTAQNYGAPAAAAQGAYGGAYAQAGWNAAPRRNW